jgi:ribosome-associated protein
MAELIGSKETKDLLDNIISGIHGGKGYDITVIDLRVLGNSIADYFVICHGTSSTQVEGITRSVEKEVFEQSGEKPFRKEGLTNATWIVMDYLNVLVHVFHKEARELYALEELWADANIENIETRA